jgi:penicillin-binding protein 2
MINVMHAPNGTGKKGGLLANTQMAGKTGTAQVVAFAKDTKYNADLLPEEQRDHALFVGFAPAKDPSIAMAVMIENGGSGGSTASPVAGLLVDFWLKRQAQASNP